MDMVVRALDSCHINNFALASLCRPFCILPSLGQNRGAHLWYFDDDRRGNSKFDAFNCSGEVRSGRGYCNLWQPDAPCILYEALRLNQSNMQLHMFPRIFVIPPDDLAGFSRIAAAKVDLPDLRQVHEPGRNVAMFDAVRFWAYARVDRARINGDREEWRRRVVSYAKGCNLNFPFPLPHYEPVHTGISVADWTWAGGGEIDHSEEAQRRRGVKSGKARREKVRERNLRIIAMESMGYSIDEIAESQRVVRRTVYRVLSSSRGRAN